MKVKIPEFFRKPSVPEMLIASFLGLSVAICAADLFIPLFWERRFVAKFGFLLVATIFQTPFLLPTAGKFVRRAFAVAAGAERFWWLCMSAALGILVALVLGGAWMHQAAVLSAETLRKLAPTSYPPVHYFAEYVFLSVLAVFLGMVHADLVARRLNPEQRLIFSLLFLGLCFLGVFVVNDLLPAIDTTAGPWQFNFNFLQSIPAITPIGHDFRVGLYQPAQRLLAGEALYPATWYPPLVTVLGIPYLLFSENAAYAVHVLLLITANLICLALAAMYAKESTSNGTGSGTGHVGTVHLMLFLLVAFNLLSGYPFLFSFERGNVDIFALLFALGSLGVLLKYPNQIWVQVLLLSIAVHIKVYPVFLFALLFFVNGFRIVLPSAIVNMGLLLVLGPANAIGFIRTVLAGYGSFGVVTNHSGLSFATLLSRELPNLGGTLPLLQALCIGVPLLIWIIAWWPLRHLGSKPRTIVNGFMITVPLIVVFFPLGLDYQLVVVSSASVVLLSTIFMKMTSSQNASDYLQLLLISMLTLVIGRFSAASATTLSIFEDKYLWVVLLELLMLVNIFQQLPDSGVDSVRAAIPS